MRGLPSIARWRLRSPVQWETGLPRCRVCGLFAEAGVHESVRDCTDGTGDPGRSCSDVSRHHRYRPLGFRARRESSGAYWPD